MPFDFQQEASEYHRLEHGIRYPRYQAWEFFWEYLRGLGSFDRAAQAINLEKTALHLGFFLANWGMLRASSNLARTNLEFFMEFVSYMNDEIDPHFWGLTLEQFGTQPDEAIPLFDSTVKVIKSFDGGNVGNGNISWTDTLVSKILLGIWGQCPAFDRYFNAGFAEFKSTLGIRRVLSCNGKSLQWLAWLIQEHGWPLDGFRSRNLGLDYPKGKVVDMAFFNFGLKVVAAQELAKRLKDGGAQELAKQERLAVGTDAMA